MTSRLQYITQGHKQNIEVDASTAGFMDVIVGRRSINGVNIRDDGQYCVWSPIKLYGTQNAAVHNDFGLGAGGVCRPVDHWSLVWIRVRCFLDGGEHTQNNTCACARLECDSKRAQASARSHTEKLMVVPDSVNIDKNTTHGRVCSSVAGAFFVCVLKQNGEQCVENYVCVCMIHSINTYWYDVMICAYDYAAPYQSTDY